MPGFDATGPRGMGPGTGWGRGPCGAGLRRGAGRIGGRGLGSGAFGRGRRGPGWGGTGPGWRYGSRGLGSFETAEVSASGIPPDEVKTLREEESYLKRELETIQQRLAALENSARQS